MKNTMLRAAAWMLVWQVSLASAFGIPEFLEFGDCAETRVVDNLDLAKYSGIWFVQQMVPNEYTDIASCSMTNYTWYGDIMTVVERGLTVDEKKVRQKSVMRLTEEEGPGVLTVEADGVPSAPYKIVGTDYENYACVYSCMGFMGFRAAFSWVFTRKPNPDTPYVALCEDLMAKNGVDPSSMEPHHQGENCPYMDRIDSLLAYTDKILQKSKDSKAKDAAVVKEAKDSKHATTEEPEVTVNELQTLIENEEKRLQEVERRLEEEEEKLLTRIEEGEEVLLRQLEENERKEEELLTNMKKEVRKGQRQHHRDFERRPTHTEEPEMNGSSTFLGLSSVLLSALFSLVMLL